MKNFVFALSFAVAFLATTIFAGAEDAVCSDDELNKITTCYKASYGESVTIQDITRSFLSRNITKESWEPVCAQKTKLTECIGMELLQKCFNVPSISKLPFVFDNEALAKIVIADFIGTDLICDKLYKFSDQDYKCLLSLETLHSTCRKPEETDDCKVWHDAAKCFPEYATQICGKTIGCFTKQVFTLVMCFMDAKCPGCDGISYTNNQIDGICDA